MKEDKQIKAGKDFDQWSEEEKKLITGISAEEHQALKARYGKRLRHLVVQVSDDERYDYLLVRPDKNLILAMASHKDDLNAANELLIKNCVKAGDMEAVEDSAVYTTVLSAVAQLISGQAAFISKA